MIYSQVEELLLAGSKVRSGRMGENEYLGFVQGVGITLYSPLGDLTDWSPSMTDLVTKDWSIVEDLNNG